MKKKIILIISLIICICSIFMGSYAYYRIVVQNKISVNTGNVVFNFKGKNNEDLNNKTIILNDGNKVFPGNSGEFTITLDASGSNTDMYTTLEIERGNLPTNLKFYTTSDKKSELHKYYSFLEKNKTNSETLTIYWYWNPYISNEEDNKFINLDKLEATIKVNAKQISKYATMKNGYSSNENMNGGTEFWNNNYKQYIRTIKFSNDLSNLPTNCTEENLCFDITESGSSEKVYGYLIDSGLKDSTDNTKVLYNLYIVSDSLIFAPTNCEYIFNGFKNLVSIDFNNNFNTSKVTNMRYIFYSCTSLTQLDVSNFNTSNIAYMSGLFCNCQSLTSLDLSNFNTRNVTTMRDIFALCKSLKSINLSSFNTSNVTYMWHMFNFCTSLSSLDVSSLDTRNVTDMEMMFAYCEQLETLDLSDFNTSSVTTMNRMFRGCSKLTTLDLSSFNTLNLQITEMMFAECVNLAYLDLSNFNTTSMINMSYMFSNCKSLSTEITIMNKDVTDYEGIFNNSATNENSKIIVNYISETSTLVDNMIQTKSSNSNVLLFTA